MEDKPEEQSSRWLSETIRPPQYITLKLSQPAIVTTVVFNKFHRPHACNVRRIRILGGMTADIMTCLCEGLVNIAGCYSNGIINSYTESYVMTERKSY